MISLARKTLRYEWRRFLPAMLAVCFSGVLLMMQAALVLGIFGSAAVYVKASSADIWAGFPGTQSVNFGKAVDPDAEVRLLMDPAVTKVEAYQWVDGDWSSDMAGSGSVSVYLSGISVNRDAMMFSHLLPDSLRHRLREPGAVIVDSADLDTLGITSRQRRAWINTHAVHVVAAIPGLRGLGGVNVLSSRDTAQLIAGDAAPVGSTYYVAKLNDVSQAQQVSLRLNERREVVSALQVWSADDFANQSQRFWLLDTGAGVAVLFMALIVCLVGAVITNQSFASVVAGSAREYATLNALGASRGALVRVVLEQAFLVGCVGMLLAIAVSTVLLLLASAYHVPVAMTPLVALGCIVLVAVMALFSSLMAVRSVMRADPVMLLR